MTIDPHSLVGAYAVDALEAPERALVEAHLDDCAECREELASFAAVTMAIADAHATAPPPFLRSRVMAAVGGTPQLTPARADARAFAAADARLETRAGVRPDALAADHAPAPAGRAGRAERSRARRWMPALLGAAASAVAVAIVAVGALNVGGGDDAAQIALEKDVMMVTSAPDAQSMDLDLGNGHVVASERMDGVALMGASAPMPTDGMEYQVWLVMDDGTAMPGPTFMPQDDGEYMAVVHMDLGDVTAVCITEEPAGGSTHPTMEPMLTVEL
ncbi:anti-sigma factor [Demequina muriae]|uniref:Regulator of SigK n=1 Tax=Demequina muriae TaxID=3051664 RepID=A0ABT8GE08_9MICO|nr:anti-sigma factor [Demequina sp. EGI L300058]MDN4479666.1 anti-sigma factor [Demequina sp. EGI L300058]